MGKAPAHLAPDITQAAGLWPRRGHELTPPERLAAVVLIAVASALLLLLLLFEARMLALLLEQITGNG